MSLRKRTLQGMVWTGTSYGVRFLVQFVLAAFLARLLTPTDFGIVATGALLVTFLSYFRGEGVGQALAVEKDPTQTQLSSAFWYTLAAGILMGGLIAALSPVGAFLFDEPRVAPVFLLSGLAIAIGSTTGVHGGIMSREMRFKALAARDIAGQLFGGLVALVLALQGYGFYALAMQSVAAAAFKSVFLWIAARWRPSAIFDWDAFKGLLKFGSNVTGFQIFNYLASNMDQLLLARFLGPADLAFYRQGGMVVRLPSKSFHQVATKVMLPALAKMEEPRKAGLAVLESNRLACGALFLPFVATFVLAAEIVAVLYGSQWDESVFVVQGFSILAFPQIIALNVGWLYKSRGRPDLQLRFAVIGAPIRLIAILAGLYFFQLEGVVFALLVTGYGILPMLSYPLGLAELRWRDILWSLRGILVATLGAGAAMYALRLVLERTLLDHAVVLLALCGLAGALVYAGILWLLDRRLWREARAFVRDMRQARSAGAIPASVLARSENPPPVVAASEPPISSMEPLVPDPVAPPGGPPKPPGSP